MTTSAVAGVVAADTDELVQCTLCIFSFFFQEIVVGKQGRNVLGLVPHARASFDTFFSVTELHHNADFERVVADFRDSSVGAELD